jgi:hypothetical protein
MVCYKKSTPDLGTIFQTNDNVLRKSPSPDPSPLAPEKSLEE